MQGWTPRRRVFRRRVAAGVGGVTGATVDFNPLKIRIGAVDETGAAFKSVDSGLKGMEKSGLNVKKALADLAGPLTIAAAVSLGKSALAAGDEIKTLSDRLGVGAEAISQYKYVAGQTGTDLESLTKGLKLSNRAVSEAARGNKELADRFHEIGLSVADLRAMKPQEAFEAIGGAIAQLENEGDRTNAAMALMGKSGADLIPVFSGGAEAIAAMRAEADRLGITMTDEAAAACDSANDSVEALRQTFMATATSIMVDLAPAIQQVATDIVPLLKNAAELGKVLQIFTGTARASKVAFLETVTEDSAAYKRWLAIVQADGFEAGDNFIAQHNAQLIRARENTAALMAGEIKYTTFGHQVAAGTRDKTLAQRQAEAAARDAVPVIAEETKQTQALGAALEWVADEYELAAFARRLAADDESKAQRAGGKRESERAALADLTLSADDAAAALGNVRDTSADAFSVAQLSARAAADGISASFTAAVFDSKRKLLDLKSTAEQIFGMLVDYGFRWAVATVIPELAPVMGFGKAAGGNTGGNKSAVAPPVSAKSMGGAPISLTVNVQGVVDVTNKLSVRRLVTAIYDDLLEVAKTHGPAGAY